MNKKLAILGIIIGVLGVTGSTYYQVAHRHNYWSLFLLLTLWPLTTAIRQIAKRPN